MTTGTRSAASTTRSAPALRASLLEEDQELDEYMAAVFPKRVHTRAELLGFLDDCRQKVDRVVGGVTTEQANVVVPPPHPWAGSRFRDLLRANVRHVREHTEQLATVARGGDRPRVRRGTSMSETSASVPASPGRRRCH